MEIYFSNENYMDMTEGLRTPDGRLDKCGFRTWLLRELQNYLQRQLDRAIILSGDQNLGLLCGLKLLLSWGSGMEKRAYLGASEEAPITPSVKLNSSFRSPRGFNTSFGPQQGLPRSASQKSVQS